jgi:hypothetical protein
MDRGTRRWIAAILGPPLNAVRFFFNLAFGGPLDMLDRRIARKHEGRLKQDVCDALPFLFAEYGGQIMPNVGTPFPPAFDFAFVTVAARGLVLRFARGRGELGVQVAPQFAPSDWHDLALVLSAIADGALLKRRQFSDLWEVSRLLQPQFNALAELFSLDRFGDLKQRLDEGVYSRERIAIQAWQREINRRLHGP